MTILYVTAAHIISMVCWFSGLFYVVRLFIYFVEAGKKSLVEKEILQKQFLIMQRRLWYGITWPAMIATVGFGLWLVTLSHVHKEGWFHFKLLFVLPLILYHFQCGRFRRQCAKGTIETSSFKLRLFNELATLFLVMIVFTVYLKSFFNGLWGIIGLVALALLLFFMAFLYGKMKRRNSKKDKMAKKNPIEPELNEKEIRDEPIKQIDAPSDSEHNK
ncbi:CopD family protein [bacterium]|jgi:protoporphyrinogen IX oxidase|nr:CopD family protein [bacterium]